MRELTDELAQLHSDPLPAVSDGQVAADLARGRGALRRRRALLGSGAASVAVAAAVVGLVLGTGPTDATRSAPVAGGTPASSAPPVTSVRPSTPSKPAQSSTPVPPSVKLVAWHGKQLKGFTVKSVPKGYVLQGVSDSVLAIAQAGDKSSINEWVHKLVVRLDDHEGSQDGTQVYVGSHSGWYGGTDGVQVLTYDAFGRHVTIQAWSDVKINRTQLIAFARGVKVTSDAVAGKG